MRVLDRVQREGRLEIAPGCYVTYDLQAIEILRGLLRVGRLREALDRYYDEFVERNDARPLAVEALHDGFSPRAVRREHGPWLGWVEGKGGLTRAQARARQRHDAFLGAVEATDMTRSYKMLVLLGMLNADRFPGTMTVEEVAEAVLDLATRNPRLMTDLGPAATDRAALLRLLQDYPLRVWSEGRGTGGVCYFTLEDGRFSTTLEVQAEDRSALQELLREIADWRLADYLLSNASGGSGEE